MLLQESLINMLRPYLNDLQEAWDASPQAEQAGQCLPVEDWLEAVLAAYAQQQESGGQLSDDVDGDEVEGGEDQEEAEEGRDGQEEDAEPAPLNGDWLSDAYWQGKILSEDDLAYGYPANEATIVIRKQAGKTADEIGSIPPLGIFKFLRDENGRITKTVSGKLWYKIQYGNIQGYVMGSEIIGDFSPACCAIKDADSSVMAKAAAMLNDSKSSYKVFNRIHHYPGDENLSIGFQHLAKDNELKFFLKVGEDKAAFDDLCRYVAYRLYTDDNKQYSYKWQAANDEIFKRILFPGVAGEISADQLKDPNTAPSAEQWLAAVQLFFSKNGVLNENKQTCPASGKSRGGLMFWAESQIVAQTGKSGKEGPYKQLHYFTVEEKKEIKNINAEIAEMKDKGKSEEEIKRKEEEKPKGAYYAKLFEADGDDPDKYNSGFWFHDIVKDALLLKSVAEIQISYWSDKYYKNASDKANEFGLGQDAAAVLSLASWYNSASSEEFDFSGSTDDMVTLSTKPRVTNLSLSRSQLEEALPVPESGEKATCVWNAADAKTLLLWMSYNQMRINEGKDKDKPRARMRVIWDGLMADKWQLRPGLSYPMTIDDILLHK